MTKTLEEIDNAFKTGIPAGSLVSITLKEDLDIEYDHERKKIAIISSKGAKTPAQLEGYLLEYSGMIGSGLGMVELETDDQYYFNIECSQINEFKVLEKPEEDIMDA